MRTFFENKRQHAARILALAAVLITAAVGFGGCADYAAVGVGYSDAYYVPDYHPFYAGYYYDGYPWWGSGPYVVNRFVINDVHRHHVHKNIYYGRHHLSRDWGSARGRSYAHTGRRVGPGGARYLRHR
jgi:hypothetical protein